MELGIHYNNSLVVSIETHYGIDENRKIMGFSVNKEPITKSKMQFLNRRVKRQWLRPY